MNASKYYNYIYCDPRKMTPYKIKGVDIILPAEPFYVGRGKGSRKYHHISRKSAKACNPYKANKINIIQKNRLSPIIITISDNLTLEEANNQEKFLIKVIGRIDKGTGTLTNLTNGGDGYTGWVASDEYRAKRSKAYFGKGNPNYGKKHSKEVIKRISDLARERMLNPENQPMLGKKLSQEAKDKISKSKENLSKETRRKMSISAKNRPKISEETRKRISAASSGKNNGMYGRVHSEESRRKMLEKAKGKVTKPTKPVYQYDLEGNFIKEWSSQREAKVYFQISGALSGRRLTCGGFIWIKKEDFSKQSLKKRVMKIKNAKK